MASIGSFTKQNYEQFFIAADLVDVLETGESIDLTNVDVSAIDGNLDDATAVVLQAATIALDDSPDGGTDNMVKIRVQAGVEADSPYKITFKMPTNLNNKWELDLKMKLKET